MGRHWINSGSNMCLKQAIGSKLGQKWVKNGSNFGWCVKNGSHLGHHWVKNGSNICKERTNVSEVGQVLIQL